MVAADVVVFAVCLAFFPYEYLANCVGPASGLLISAHWHLISYTQRTQIYDTDLFGIVRTNLYGPRGFALRQEVPRRMNRCHWKTRQNWFETRSSELNVANVSKSVRQFYEWNSKWTEGTVEADEGRLVAWCQRMRTAGTGPESNRRHGIGSARFA